VLSADKLATFMCRFSGNLGVSSSYNPNSLSWPVTRIALSSPLLPECMGNPVTTLQISWFEAVVPELLSESRADVAVCSTQAVWI